MVRKKETGNKKGKDTTYALSNRKKGGVFAVLKKPCAFVKACKSFFLARVSKVACYPKNQKKREDMRRIWGDNCAPGRRIKELVGDLLVGKTGYSRECVGMVKGLKP